MEAHRSLDEIIGELRFIAHDLRLCAGEAATLNARGVYGSVAADLDDAADELEEIRGEG